MISFNIVSDLQECKLMLNKAQVCYLISWISFFITEIVISRLAITIPKAFQTNEFILLLRGAAFIVTTIFWLIYSTTFSRCTKKIIQKFYFTSLHTTMLAVILVVKTYMHVLNINTVLTVTRSIASLPLLLLCFTAFTMFSVDDSFSFNFHNWFMLICILLFRYHLHFIFVMINLKSLVIK